MAIAMIKYYVVYCKKIQDVSLNVKS